VEAHIQNVGAQGKIRLPDVIPLPDWAWFAILAIVAINLFALLGRRMRPRTTT
jgi:hypothetical protein